MTIIPAKERTVAGSPPKAANNSYIDWGRSMVRIDLDGKPFDGEMNLLLRGYSRLFWLEIPGDDPDFVKEPVSGWRVWEGLDTPRWYEAVREMVCGYRHHEFVLVVPPTYQCVLGTCRVGIHHNLTIGYRVKTQTEVIQLLRPRDLRRPPEGAGNRTVLVVEGDGVTLPSKHPFAQVFWRKGPVAPEQFHFIDRYQEDV